MALDENLLFQTLFAERGDKSIEEIMQEVAKAKAAFNQAEQSIAKEAEEINTEEETKQPTFELKHLTRRHLLVDPQSAITNEYITCCLCGRNMKTVSSAHLRKHGTTPEIYRKLCGYAPDRILMSGQREEQMRMCVRVAHEKRMSRKKSKMEAEQQ
ncbi:MAG: MucR family transcriptional regulator [Desulfovibrio sp.]|nr:MucR family transcriptional regulator [Desulfovibrio sp.]